MKTFLSKSAEETKEFAKEYASQLLGGGIIALSGDLGAGKTTFAQGFAQGLYIHDRIVSPTFLTIRQYQIPNQKNFFYHIDLYRMENIDLKNSGLEEIWSDPSNVVLIEWADKIIEYLPELVKRVHLKRVSENVHEINLTQK